LRKLNGRPVQVRPGRRRGRGMRYGEVNLGSRSLYTLVGLSALYLASQLRTLTSTSQPTPATSVTN
jgi:hypothetical protein